MPAKHRNRLIRALPDWMSSKNVVHFKPAGIPIRDLEVIVLSDVELDCLRYADLDDEKQTESASKMSISQPSFSRHLKIARRKVADALINGKALTIETGQFPVIKTRFFKCVNCNNSWGLSVGTGRPESCPKCGSTDFFRDK
ncbi:MAG: DUF134 domain-containing protein [Candidatus Hodarchaeales archaeon]